MKYLKKFEKFNMNQEKQPLEITADMNMFNSAEDNQKEFKNSSRKNQLLQIYQTYTPDNNMNNSVIPADLFNKLKAGKFLDPKSTVKNPIWINPLFKVYAEFCQQQRTAKQSQQDLELKKQTVDNANKAKQTNQGDPKVLDQDIETANAGIKDEDSKLQQTQKNAKALKDASDKELKARAKELEDAKNRIDNLKMPKNNMGNVKS